MVNGLWFILGIVELYLHIWYRYLTEEEENGGGHGFGNRGDTQFVG
jgi:hypothetical protein